MTNLDKLKSIATKNSTWLEDAKERQENKEWLKHSQKIAIKVLRTLREKQIKQTELATLLGVSPQQVNKIVKGRENLTLETISKLEQKLGISLIFSSDENQTVIKEIIKEKIVYLNKYLRTEEVAKQKIPYVHGVEYFQPQLEYDKCVGYDY